MKYFYYCASFCFLICVSLLTQAQPRPLSIMLDWELNPDHAPLWVAEHYGFFAEQNLAVQLIPPADPTDPAKFAAIGKVDLALTYEPQWIVQTAQGLPLIWVGTLVPKPLAAMVTREDISSLKDLKGKTIGYSSGAIDQIFLLAMLKHENLARNDVKLINLHYDLMQALIAHKIDAMTGAMRNVEPLELQQKNFKFHLFKPEDYGVPPYAELIFVSGKQNAQDPRFKDFLKGLKKGILYLKTHSEETWQAFAKANPALNDEADHQIWLNSVHYFSDHPEKFDRMQYERFKQFMQPEQMPS